MSLNASYQNIFDEGGSFIGSAEQENNKNGKVAHHNRRKSQLPLKREDVYNLFPFKNCQLAQFRDNM